MSESAYLSDIVRGMPNKPLLATKAVERITPGEASRITGLSPKQLGRMADRGQIESARPSGTQRRYVRAEIEALMAPEQHGDAA